MRFTFALLFASALVSIPAAGQKAPSQQKVELETQRILDEHKDSTGQVRSDLWRKGIEDTKKLKVAAGINVGKSTGKRTGQTGLLSISPQGSAPGTGVRGVVDPDRPSSLDH